MKGFIEMSNQQNETNLIVEVLTKPVVNIATKEQKVANICYVDGEMFNKKIYSTLLEAEADKMQYANEVAELIYKHFNSSK